VGRVNSSIQIEAPLAEVWDLYFRPGGWAGWVDGFGSVVASSGYPDAGGTLRWRSTPAGRGLVSEHVLEHEPRRLHRIAFEDVYASGEQTTWFEISAAAEGTHRTIVTLQSEYRLQSPGPFGRITDSLFVRPQMRRSLERSLSGLAAADWPVNRYPP
jgi:hypothetical protein